MVIFLWTVLVLVFISTLITLLWLTQKYFKQHDGQHIFWEGFKTALRSSGFQTGPTYSVELYRWVNTVDTDVCDVARERMAWPAHDIADWMKVGLPDSDLIQSQCGKDCHCQLIYVGSRPVTPK